MNNQGDAPRGAQTNAESEMRDTGNEATRADEQGDVAEADAPTDMEENVGMSTVLGGGGVGTGIQTDSGDE